MPLRRELCVIVAMSSFIATACAQAVSQVAPGAPQRSDPNRQINLPIAQWLAQDERSDIPWKVAFGKPVLTFRLIGLLTITAEVNADALQRQGMEHDLHFIVKIAHEKGSWDEGESYSHFLTEQGLNGKLRMRAGVYLKPGAYTVATILYDAASERRNLSFYHIQVKGPHSSQVPELLSEAPEISFLGSPENTGPLGPRRVPLPVEAQRAILFDLIVDLSTREESGDRLELTPPNSDAGRSSLPTTSPNPLPTPNSEQLPMPPTPPRERQRTGNSAQQTLEQSRLQEIAKTLAKMDFQPGCTRVTALDVLRLGTLLPPTPAGDVDWQQLGKENSVADKVMVSVDTLGGRKEAGQFFQEQIARTMAQPPQCNLNSSNPLHVIAILSHGIHFPSGSKTSRIEPGCNCKVFYFYESHQDIGGVDDLGKMLEPLSPRLLEFGNAETFRERVFEFAEAVKGIQ